MQLNKSNVIKKYSNRAVLTIATGKPIYIQMAVNLARSFKWWHKDSDIRFVLATDLKNLLPQDLSDLEVIELQPGQLGQGFSPKLYLDTLAPAERTLFIDADCLCVGSLESVFDRFAGRKVSVIGKTITEGEFFGDVESVRRQFNLKYLPYFVGGIYYLEKGEISTKVYETARALEARYDEIGLVRLRGRPNEEPLMAISMSIHEQTPIIEDGSIKAEPMFYPSGMNVDVIKGNATLWNSPSHPLHCFTWSLTRANPLIVHFHCGNAERSPYTRECLKLEMVIEDNWNPFFANIYAFLKLSVPQIVIDFLKDTFRPSYRKIFGVRPVRLSERVVKPMKE
jgi:hypothetical protein